MIHAITELWGFEYTAASFPIGFQGRVENSIPLPLDLQIQELTSILLRTLPENRVSFWSAEAIDVARIMKSFPKKSVCLTDFISWHSV